MSRKKTRDEFIVEAISVHGDKYDYSLVEYTGYDKKIKVICKTHGEFKTQARCHLKSDCPKCAAFQRTTTFDEFTNKANKVHNNRYVYDEHSYTNTNSKLNIFCEHHGWFEQMGHQHLGGNNCIKCTHLLSGSTQRTSQEDFIKRAKQTHINKYSYEKVIYKNANTKVSIWCNKCEKYFKQIPSLHLKHGCKACSDKSNGLNLRKTNEQYIKDVDKVHKSFYSYEKTNYNKIGDKITVTCPIHGDFSIRASDHISGSGCIPCSIDIKKYNGWGHSLWEEFGNKSKNFIAFQTYVIKCTDTITEEIFYKIGKTYLDIKYRFSGKSLPYDYEIIKIFTGNGKEISKLEIELHRKYKQFQYLPNNTFGGYTECYAKNLPIQEIINL